MGKSGWGAGEKEKGGRYCKLRGRFEREGGGEWRKAEKMCVREGVTEIGERERVRE